MHFGPRLILPLLCVLALVVGANPSRYLSYDVSLPAVHAAADDYSRTKQPLNTAVVFGGVVGPDDSDVTFPVNISVNGGTISVNSGTFASTATLRSARDTLAIRIVTGNRYDTEYRATATIGNDLSQDFVVRTISESEASFYRFSQPLNTAVVFGGVVGPDDSDVTFPVNISVNGGTISVNSGTFASTATLRSARDTLAIRIVTGNRYDTEYRATATIGNDLSQDFVVRTVAGSSSASTAGNSATANASTSSPSPSSPSSSSSSSSSSSATASSASASSSASSASGNSSVVTNSGSRTTTGSVSSGIGTSSAASSASSNAAAGSSSSSSASHTTSSSNTGTQLGTSTQATQSSTPNGSSVRFSFATKTNAPIDTDIVSEEVRIATAATFPISVRVTGGEVLIGSVRSSTGGVLTSSGTVLKAIIHTAKYSTSYSARVTIGNTTQTFMVKTVPDPFKTPVTFTIAAAPVSATGTDVTANISIATRNVVFPVPVMASGASLVLSGTTVVPSGTVAWVSSGQTLAVRLHTGTGANTNYNASVTVGSTKKTFTVKTVPDPFKTPVTFTIAAAPVSATGTDVTADISIATRNVVFPVPVMASGASLVLSGTTVVPSGTVAWVSSGQTLAVRLHTGTGANTNYNASVTVGSTKKTFTVRTRR